MDHGRAVKIRNALVYLCDNYFGSLNGGFGKVCRNVIAAIAVLVRKRAVYTCHINRNFPAAEQARNFTEETRYQAAVSVSHVFALVCTEEHGVHYE